MKLTQIASGSILAGLAAFGMGVTAVAAERPPTSTQPPTYTTPATSSASGATDLMGSQDRPVLDSSMSHAKVDDLIGMEVVNADGKEVGKVKEIARDRDDQSLHMIVATGGYLGLGEKHMALPVENARLEGDKVHLMQSLGEQQIQQDVASYNKENYQEISKQEREETVAAVATGATSG